MKRQLKTAVYPTLAALPDSYSGVFQSGSRCSFFLTRDWFENFAEHVVADPTRLRIYCVETQDGNPLAALPLCMTSKAGGFLSPRVLEGLSNYYTCHFVPVVRDGENVEEIVGAITDSIWRDRQTWDILKLQPLDFDSSIFRTVVRALRNRGILFQTFFSFGNWYLEVAGRSYKEYLDQLPSVLRKNIPYNLRRLERLGNSRIVIHKAEAGLDQALDAYEAVYNSSWKIREASPGFIRGLGHIAAKNGWLRLGLVYIDGQPAAAQLWIVFNGVASIYKIAYDERFAKLSVGAVLTAKLMEEVIDVDKVRIVDYLSGEDEYKKSWMSHRREFWGIIAFNRRTTCGLAHAFRHMGGNAARRLQRIGTSKLK